MTAPLLSLFLFALLATAVAPTAIAQSPSSAPDRTALASYCRQSSSTKLGACTLLLRAGCQSDATKPYCNTLSVYNALCAYDNPSDAAPLCQNYRSYCAANQAECNTVSNMAWPKWTNSSVFQYQIKRMCDFHNMEGCDRCSRPAPSASTPLDQLDPCDSLATYSLMCKAMPDMTMCNVPWRAMCQALPNSPTVFSNVCSAAALEGDDTATPTPGSNVSAPGTGAGGATSDTSSDDSTSSFGNEIPPMRMYFHQDINDLLLFRFWVTRTQGQYWGATIGMFFFSLAYYALQALVRARVTPTINRGLAEIDAKLYRRAPMTDSAPSSPALAPMGGSSSSATLAAGSGVPATSVGNGNVESRTSLRLRRELLVAARSGVLVVELAWAYILMLAAMSFNIGWILAFLLGAFVGNMCFNRKPGHFAVAGSGDHHMTRGDAPRYSTGEGDSKDDFRQPECC